jgi:hypothetical protein
MEHQQHVFGSSKQNLIPSKHLIQAFARLERQLCEISERPKIVLELTQKQTLKGYYECYTSRPQLGAHFETFDDAWKALDHRWHAMHAWLAKIQNLATTDSTMSEFLSERSDLFNDFSDWKTSFDKLKREKDKSPTRRERCISSFLDCHMVLARLILDIAIESGEMSWDRHVEDFEQVVQYCCSVVEAENSFAISKGFSSLTDGPFPGSTDTDGERRKAPPVMVGQRYIPQEDTYPATKTSGVLLFLDMGILPILFHVIRYCRDARIRLRAINFLEQYPRLEGLWSSLLVARLARSLDAIERQSFCLEEDAMRGASVDEIACESRISKIDISFGGTREAHVIFHKPDVVAGVGNIRIRETITW